MNYVYLVYNGTHESRGIMGAFSTAEQAESYLEALEKSRFGDFPNIERLMLDWPIGIATLTVPEERAR
jgi:hypothetical protein